MKTAKIVLTVVLLFFFVALSGCMVSESLTDGGIFGGEQTTTTVSPEGVTTTTTVGVGPWGTITSRSPKGATCTFLPEGSEGRDHCIYDAVVMRGEPASRCNEIVDEALKADCIANSPAGQTGG